MRNFTKNFQEQPFSLKQHALRLCLLFVFLVIGGMQLMSAQTTGDYRTGAATVTWATAANWQTWSGTAWVTASSAPSSTNDVYVQAGHTATLGAAGSCKNLFISSGTTSATTGTDALVALAANTLSISGKLASYFGAVSTTLNSVALSITATSTIPATPITMTAASAGVLKFVGTSRTIASSTEWGAGNTASTSTFAIEIAMTSGETATMASGIKAQNWLVSSGTLDAGTNRIAPDNGATGGGNFTLNSGATVISSATGTLGNAVIGRTTNATTGYGGTILVNSGATLILKGTSPNFAMTTITLNGTVEYGASGTQTFAVATGGGSNTTSYTNLTISGSGVKTTALATSVTGTTTVNTGCTLATSTTITLANTPAINGSFQLNVGGWATGGTWNYGSTGTLVFANATGSYGVNADVFWPVTNGPVNVTVSGAGGITMNVARTVPATGTTGTFLVSAGAVAGTALTLNGTTQINGGSFSTTPTYGASSTLVYNTTYGTSNEWTGGASTSVAAGSGIPANVQVLSGTLTLGGGRGVPGNVTVTAGGLVLNATSGDLYIGGNLTHSGTTWTNNGRAVVFVGTGTSVINTSANTNVQFFDYLLVNKSSGSVQIGSTTNVTLNITVGSVLQFLNAGTLDLNGRTLTLNNSGGNILVDGTTGGTSKTITSSTGTGTIAVTNSKTASANASGTLTTDANVTWLLTGGMSYGGVTTINGKLQINSGGFVVTNAPTYGTGSTLIYNVAAGYSRNLEWSATSGAGYPYHILVGNGLNTSLDAVNSTTIPKKIAGNLTVSNGSSFFMTNLINGTGGVGIEIAGNIINDGTVTLNGTTNQRLKCANFTNGSTNTTATTNLSSVVGGDLELTGNYVDNATFTANSRAVFFTGTGTQTIGGTASAPFNIDYIVSTKSSGSVQLLQNLLTAAPNTGNAITLSSSTDIFDLNGFTLTLGTASLASTISGTGKFKGGSTSGLSLLGTGAFGTINFDQTTPGTTNLLNTFTLNRTSSGSVTLGSDLSVSGTTTLTAGQLILGSSNLTVGASGSIAVTAPDATKMIVATGAGELRKVYSGTGSFVFPVGDATSTAEYSPVTLDFTSGSFSSAYAGVKLSNSKQSNNASATDYINRYWTVSTSGITTPVCNASFIYTDGDIAGTEANLFGGRYLSSTWNFIGAVTTATNTISGTLTAFGDITAGDSTSVGCVNPTAGGTIATAQTICSGTAPAAFTSSTLPTGHNGTLEYVWQSSTTSSSAGFSDIASSNTNAFTPVATITQTTWYKRLARVSCKTSWTGAAESNVIQVSIDTPTVAGTVAGGTTICSGSTSGTLTLSGHTGSVVRWESSVSPFSSWTTIANTTTTYTSGALSATTQFRAVVQSGSCSEAAATATTVSIGGTTTWNGTAWSNSAPTSTSAAIIAGDYSVAANITACSLTVTSGTVVIPSGYNVMLNSALTVSGGTFTLNNNANLIQTTADANSGSITVKRDTSMRRLDYTYWSSPVASQNLLSFSPQTLTNRFFTFDESANAFAAVTDPSATNFDIAKGYNIRASNFLPPAGTIVTVNSQFDGVPNNGTKTIAVNYSGSGKGFNLIGNPYPSTIDADAFLNYSGNAGTIYFWTHYVQQAGSSNYATFNTSGATSGANGITPNGKIQIGQGFMYAKTSSGTATFTNAMRVGNNSNQFFRNSAPVLERHRIWLNLSSATTVYNQTLVGYIEGATQGIDAGIDGTILETGTTISSRINNENYVIQGRALPFDATDVVPLSFSAATADSYSLNIDHVDGLFSGSQAVYLKDNLLGTTHDIKANPYTFTSDVGTFDNRFEIVYTSSPLAVHTPTFDANSVIVYKQNEAININAGATVMASIKVFDIRGRLLFENNAVNATTTTIKNLKAEQQMLLVQITSNDASVVTKKILY